MNNDYLKNITPKGSDNYYALLKVTPEQREQVSAILCLFNTLFSILFTVSDDTVAKAKLNWWQQEIEKSLQGNPSHPITKIFKAHRINLLSFNSIISEIQTLLNYCHFDTFEELMIFIMKTFGAQELAIAEVMNIDSKQHKEAIYQSAMVLALTEFTKNLRLHAKKSFFFIAENELKQCSVTRQDILNFTTNENINALLALQHDKVLKATPFKLSRPTYLRHQLALQWWQAVKTEDYRILEQQVLIPAVRKLLRTWFRN